MQVYAAFPSLNICRGDAYGNVRAVVYANSMLASLNVRSSLHKRPQIYESTLPGTEMLPIRDTNTSRDDVSPDDFVSILSLVQNILTRHLITMLHFYHRTQREHLIRLDFESWSLQTYSVTFEEFRLVTCILMYHL